MRFRDFLLSLLMITFYKYNIIRYLCYCNKQGPNIWLVTRNDTKEMLQYWEREIPHFVRNDNTNYVWIGRSGDSPMVGWKFSFPRANRRFFHLDPSSPCHSEWSRISERSVGEAE